MNASVLTSANSSKTAQGLDFHIPTPEDFSWAQPLLFSANRQGCEFCFGNIYAWCEKYDTQITQANGFFLSRSSFWEDNSAGGTVYCFPICETYSPSALRETIQLLREDARQFGARLTLYGLTNEDIPRLEAACPGEFLFEEERNDADYIYRQADLATLAGKKYHQKRNHITRFVKNNSWSCEEIGPENMEECLEMSRVWEQINTEKDPKGLEQELNALRRVFAHYNDFGMKGAALRAAGKIVAFTVGEALNKRTFCTHFEKAYIAEPGTYQMINRCFAQQALGGYEFVNREEDLGDEGLRRAKLSYYPAILLEKFTATEK